MGSSDGSPAVETTGSALSGAPPRRSLGSISARERGLWREVFIVLIVLALGFVILALQQVRSSWPRVALSFGLLLSVVAFSAYVSWKLQTLSKLRRRGHVPETPPVAGSDLKHSGNLFELVERSQRGYRDLIDTFDDVLFSLSLDGCILAANRSFTDIVNRPFAQVIGQPLDNFVDLPLGDGRSVAQKALPQLFQRRRWTGTLRLKMKHDGSAKYFACSIHSLVREGEGRGLCVIARDVTAERENEARFGKLLDSLSSGIYSASEEGRFEYANPALTRLLGFQSAEDIFGHSLAEFGLDAGAAQDKPAAVNTTKVEFVNEITVRRRDGFKVTCLHVPGENRDPGGKVCGRYGIVIDLPGRLDSGKRSQREQQFAHRLIESFPDVVLTLDREARYTFVSNRARQVIGLAPAELIGRAFIEQIDIQDRKDVRALIESILSGRIAAGGVEYRIERDGDVRLVRASASPLLGADGKIEGMIASIRDITDSKRNEQQLIQTERLAAMGQMIAGVAHELNNPLTAVLGVTELLRDASTETSVRRQLEIAHRQARRAAQIVQSLLTFSRPPQPRKTCVNLSNLIQRSLHLHEHSLRTNSITVEFTPNTELPPVLADVSQLTQVFLNLIANAEQAITEVRNHGTLRIRLTVVEDRVIASFQDDGVGIRRDVLPRIFDPFFTTKRPGRGTGLGLSICMAILREHGGQIDAQPVADGGSVFTISLPIASGTSTFLIEPAASDANTSAAPSDRLAGCSVLVVDDEESMRELVREGLSIRGLRVDAAATAEEALSLLERRRYDVVVCDLNLRGDANAGVLSGPEFHAKVLSKAGSKKAEMPFFVFITGDLLSRGQDLVDGTRILQKPFRISELTALLSENLPKVGAG